MLTALAGAGLTILKNCPVMEACPLDGTHREVVDCLARSTWYEKYPRQTDYGTPFTEDLGCPPIWLNCSNESEGVSTVRRLNNVDKADGRTVSDLPTGLLTTLASKLPGV